MEQHYLKKSTIREKGSPLKCSRHLPLYRPTNISLITTTYEVQESFQMFTEGREYHVQVTPSKVWGDPTTSPPPEDRATYPRPPLRRPMEERLVEGPGRKYELPPPPPAGFRSIWSGGLGWGCGW